MTIPFLLTLASLQNEAPKATLAIEPGTVVAGSLVKAVVTLTFAPGLHGYQNPPSEDYMIPIAIKGVEGGSQLSVRYPKGEPATVGGEASPVMTYAGRIEIPVLVRVPSQTGDQTVKVSIGYQLCNEQACFPPGTVVATSRFNVTPVPSGWTAVKRRIHDVVGMTPQATEGS